VIETRGLTRRFNSLLAVDNLNLHVNEGEIFGLLGPNGAGKTTTIRMLTCLIAPSAGEATVNGLRVGQDDTAIRRCVGILTESPGLYEKLSAYQNLAFYADLYEVEKRDSQVEKYLRMLDLWDRRNETVAGFSKGMKQKLAIARALIHEPKVLFLDEPTAALDPQAAKTVREFIQELKSEKRTIFICTHNLSEAEHLCDRVAVLKTRLIAVDTPENLRRQLFGRKTVIQLKTVEPRMIASVRALDFVQDVQQVNNSLVVRLSTPEEQNPIIVQKLVQAGAQVQFVTELQHSLEDIYLTLIKEAER